MLFRKKLSEEEREEMRQAAKTLVRLWPFEFEVGWADVYAELQRISETGVP